MSVSVHGYFAQSNALGKPDSGGQIVYVLDSVRALEKELNSRIEAALGPALIEQAGSTIVVGPGDTYMLDAFGNVRISVGARSGQSA